jgi:glutamate 5-kinase
MQSYESEFALYDLHVAQILLTRDDFNDRRRYINARRALTAVHTFGAIPIVNENDTVATEEIRFGDNDQLAAMVAAMMTADLLFLLSDVDGLYTQDPRLEPDAERILSERAHAARLDPMVADSPSGVGTGGMRTKLLAARLAATVAIPTVIAHGKRPAVISDLLAGAQIGTRLYPDPGAERVPARKAWIGTGPMPRGRIFCDDGAVHAIFSRGKSLLPSGIVRVEGDFQEGDAVELADSHGSAFAQGLSSYPASAVRKIMGHQSTQIFGLLGYRTLDAVVHRDELALDLQFEPHE